MIDRDLLCHSVEVGIFTGYDEDRNKTYDTVSINYVRISYETKIIDTGQGLGTADNMVLWYDMTYSEPLTWTPQEGDIVTYNERTYTVTSVKPCFDLSSTPDFYKVYLK